MSYEGYVEYLTEKGYYLQVPESYGMEEPPKEYLGDPIAYSHTVDITNGYANSREYLKPGEAISFYDENAPKAVIGFDDKWQEDHYGNRYATKILRHKPDLRFWRPL